MQRPSFSAFFNSLLYPLLFIFIFPLKLPKCVSERNNQLSSRHFFVCVTEKMLWKPYFGISTFGRNNRKNKERWKRQPPPPPKKKKVVLSCLGVHRRNQQDQSSKIQHEITKEHLEERKERVHACLKILLSLLVIKPKKKKLRKKKTVSFLVNGIFLLTSYWETRIYILPGGLHGHCG